MKLALKNLRVVLPLLCFCFFSCKKESNPIPISTPPSIQAPQENPFIEYVDRFFEEAKKRNANINRDNLTVAWMSDTSSEYCGYGYSNYNNTGARRVEIKPLSGCWEDRNDLEKEALMFHELGHAVLERGHFNLKLGNGLEKSLMCGGTFGCDQFDLYSEFTPALRTFYLDELFNPQVVVPEWAEEKTKSSIFLEHRFEEASDSWDFFSANNHHKGAIAILESDSSTVLTIQSTTTGGGNDQFSRWRHQIIKPDLPETATLRLTATMSGEDILGQGVSIVLRTDSGLAADQMVSGFGTTQGETLIKGTFDKKEFSVDISYVPSEIEDLFVFLLLLPETQGKVYFHDIKLMVLE